MTIVDLRRLAAVLFAVTAAGCAGRAHTLSPVHAIPVGGIPDDPVPGERYYLIVFGSESTPKVPRYTHTWATAVKTVEADGCAPQMATVDTISWMPADLDIQPWVFRPEPGRNLELHETIIFALGERERVAQWGPYEIRPGLYRRFLMQKAYMESGRVGYQCIDTVGEGADGSGCDCIHAVTDMDPEMERGYYRLTRFGQAGSKGIVGELFARGVVINPGVTHDWLNAALGLCRYPITHRTDSTRPRRLPLPRARHAHDAAGWGAAGDCAATPAWPSVPEP
jgi:hypothetical protein